MWSVPSNSGETRKLTPSLTHRLQIPLGFATILVSAVAAGVSYMGYERLGQQVATDSTITLITSFNSGHHMEAKVKLNKAIRDFDENPRRGSELDDENTMVQFRIILDNYSVARRCVKASACDQDKVVTFLGNDAKQFWTRYKTHIEWYRNEYGVKGYGLGVQCIASEFKVEECLRD